MKDAKLAISLINPYHALASSPVVSSYSMRSRGSRSSVAAPGRALSSFMNVWMKGLILARHTRKAMVQNMIGIVKMLFSSSDSPDATDSIMLPHVLAQQGKSRANLPMPARYPSNNVESYLRVSLQRYFQEYPQRSASPGHTMPKCIKYDNDEWTSEPSGHARREVSSAKSAAWDLWTILESWKRIWGGAAACVGLAMFYFSSLAYNLKVLLLR